MIVRLFRSTLALSLAAVTVLAPVAPVSAQQQSTQQGQQGTQQGAMSSQQQAAPPAAPQPQSPVAERTIPVSNLDYSRAPHWFPNVLRPYQQKSVPEPVLTNSPRIEQMIQDGKLRLTLQDAIELGLQNDLDIQIQRYTPWIAETQILSAMGGGSVRGSNGAAVSFDPTLTGTFSKTVQTQQITNPFLSGVSAATTSTALTSWNNSANFTYAQAFHTGTGINLSWNNSRVSSTNAQNIFNPAIQTTLFATVTQPLLNGFGLLVNTHFIQVAKLNKNISDYQFKQQVITSLTQVADAYWELVAARDNVGVQQQAVATSDKFYSDTKKEVDIGTVAPLNLVQAEAGQATAKQSLVNAQTLQSQDQLALWNLISKNAQAFHDVEIIPLDSANTPPPPVEQIPLEDAVKEAIANRPDVLQSAEQLKVDDINIKVARNALLPFLNLQAQYGAVGLSGNTNILSSSQVPGSAVVTPCTAGNPNCPTSGFAPVTVEAQDPNNPGGPLILVPVFLPPGTVTKVTGVNQAGLGSALNSAFRGQFPDYGANITLTIPIRNRVAQAASVDAILLQRQDETRYRQFVNNAAVAVHTAQITLAQDRVSVDAAAKTSDLDRQTLDAEQKKLQLGASTVFNVVQDQNILAQAQGAEVRARVNLQEAKVAFDNVLARTLQVFSITIAESKSGNVSKDTLIPGTSVTGALVGLSNGNSSDNNSVPASALAPTTPAAPSKPQQEPPHR